MSSNQFDAIVYCLKLGLSSSLDISFKFCKGDFITAFKASILLSFFLYGIICKVNEFVFQIFQGVLLACSSDVSFFVPIPLYASVYTSNQDIASYIKLALVVKERSFHVLLNDEGPAGTTFLRDQ